MIYGKRVFEKDGRFQEIHLTRLPDGKHALFLDGGIQFIEGIDEKAYHEALAGAPARTHEGPVDALILGGGDGLAARDLLSIPKVKNITMVEIDPEILEFASTHPVMRRINEDSLKNPRLNLIVDDARNFLGSRRAGLYDLIIMDFPDHSDSFVDLYGRKFLSGVLDSLEGLSGIVSVQSGDLFGDLHRIALESVRDVTQRPARTVCFSGDYSHDGAIVWGGPGATCPFCVRRDLVSRVQLLE